MKLFIGQKVRHKEVWKGSETMEVVGIRATTVELKGDFFGGTQNEQQERWMPIKGIIIQGTWGNWVDPDDDFFERITKNAGPRD